MIKGMGTRTDAGYSYGNQVGWETWVDPMRDLGVRALCTVGALTRVLSLLLIKARWINLIGSVETRHMALPARVS